MRTEEIRALSPEELKRQLAEAQRELLNLRFRHATRQLANTSQFTVVKKKIARLKTIQRERE